MKNCFENFTEAKERNSEEFHQIGIEKRP